MVENCLSDVRVTATAYGAGGICGSSGGIIRYCLVLGPVSGNTLQGGICGGYLGMYAIIQNSYFNSDVFDGKVPIAKSRILRARLPQSWQAVKLLVSWEKPGDRTLTTEKRFRTYLCLEAQGFT